MVGALIALLKLYQLVIIVRAVLTWLPVDERQPWVQLLNTLTEPVLGPLRQFTRLGTVDLSPIVAFFLIQLLIALLM